MTTAKQLHKLILEQITKPTSRGQQKKIGPSQIGGCPLCLGEALALKRPDLYPDLEHREDFGLGSWIGTAVHHFLESDVLIEGAIKEQKNFIHHLEGYGDISGSTDLFVPPHLIDWKVVGKWSYDKMCLNYRLEPDKLPTTGYRVQQHVYGHGWEQAGYDVETVTLVVIPKHSNRAEDIRFFTERYNPEVAKKALDRLELIWQYVRDGRLDELPMDEDCYTCSRVLFRV